MPIDRGGNDSEYGAFDTELQDEYGFDAHYPPGVEMGLRVQPDRGSGSYAEDGDLEVADNVNTYDGENMSTLGFEDDAVGAAKRAVAHAAKAVKKAQHAAKTAPPHVAAKHVAAAHRAVAAAEHAAASGPYAQSGATEIGDGGGGYIAQDGPSEIGAGLYSQEGASELGDGGGGYIAQDGPSEIGSGSYAEAGPAELGYGPYAQEGASELGWEDYGQVARQQAAARIARGYQRPALPPAPSSGEDYGQVARRQAALRAAQHRNMPVNVLGAGYYPTEGASELGYGPYAQEGASELGAGLYSQEGATELGAAEDMEDPTAQPFESFMLEPERMGVDAPYAYDGESEIGVKAVKLAVTKVVQKARDNRRPAPPMKAVDVDAPLEEDAGDFLNDIVVGAAVATGKDPFPLLSELLLRAGATVEPRIVRVDTEESYKQFRTAQSPELSEVRQLRQQLEEHMADPDAHELDGIDEDIADLVELGAAVKSAEDQKRVDLWMPKRFQGKVEAWREGDNVCASLAFPGQDGEVRICTSLEPVRKCVDEMTRHAAESEAPAEAVVGVLPAMGCVLGAGTMIKEVAAAAPAILSRPEAKTKMPFVVRIEPKTAPHLAALAMLAAAVRQGNLQAQDEWKRLGELSAGPVKDAMVEAIQVAKSATGG